MYIVSLIVTLTPLSTPISIWKGKSAYRDVLQGKAFPKKSREFILLYI